ncbi:MAG: tRNA (adenosine(37)-N6)-threonylcarbamoyltransferase complex ATPase subunit type 1 TsaE [Nitrospirae bacterium]|nr:MAG: tRNA (adenosine(37)-N6)-threonylcarbamoyltransferase complex ATPase subunit type 1 TsaE [Nitrospirota bacterium]
MKFLSRSAEETRIIGFRLGRLLKSRGVVCLYGDLGSGKTTFVKGIANALGIHENDVASASYTIVVEYLNNIPLYHIDLYRIEKDSDIDGAGIWDYINSEGITVIEWAERLGAVPDDFIRVKFAIIDEVTRDITIEGIDEKNWNYL